METKDTDHWRTHPVDCRAIAALLGCDGFDLDVASNLGSVVPCRARLVGPRGPAAAVDTEHVLTLPLTLGGEVLEVCGLLRPWSADLQVWCNPPWGNPAPWVVQILLHLFAGGRGAALLPGNLPESAWMQALLWASGATVVPAGQRSIATPHEIIGRLLASKGVSVSQRNADALFAGAQEWATTRQDSPCEEFAQGMTILYPNRRLGFIDGEGTYQAMNRIGQAVVMWRPGVWGIGVAPWDFPRDFYHTDPFPPL